MFDTSSTVGWQVLADGTVHVLTEDRDGKILPATMRMTKFEDKFLDELNITSQWRRLMVVIHSDIKTKGIHAAVDILLRNMKSESALSKAFESFTMKANDLIMCNRARGEKITLGNINHSMHVGRNLLQSVSIDDLGVASVGLCSLSWHENCGNDCDWRNGGACGCDRGYDCGRLLLIFFLSLCCFFRCWQSISTLDAGNFRLSDNSMVTELRSLRISEGNHEPSSAHAYKSNVVYCQGSLVTRLPVLFLVCLLWKCPQIQANRNSILNHDNYASAQWMNLPPNTDVSLLIQGDATETVDHDNHGSTSFSFACPRWWQAKVHHSKSGDPYTNATTELQVFQFVNLTALASCQVNTTLVNIRNYSFVVELWGPSGSNGIHHFLDTVTLVYDSYNLVTTTKKGFSVMVCAAGDCWNSSISTIKRRWETRIGQRKRPIKDLRLNSGPINCDYFCLVRSSDLFGSNSSLVLQDPVSFLSDFKTVDILQQSTDHDKNQKTEHLIRPWTLSDIVKHLEQNKSLVLRSFSQTNKSLAVLLRHLEKEIGCQVSMHLYVSPASLGALKMHNDSYDVLVFHVIGRKIWTLCTVENQCEEIELGPGELLYIRAGTLHSARTSETSNYSMSWTFGLLCPGYETQSIISSSEASDLRRGDCHECCYACCDVCRQNWEANSAACSYHGTARQNIYYFDYGSCADCGQVGPWICISCNSGWTGATCASPICQRGEYFQDGGCKQCAAGTFSNIDAAFLQDCIQCTAGFYQDQPGQTSCQQCPTGHYAPSPIACLECKRGSFAPFPLSTVCIACAAGKYSFVNGSSSPCLDCPPGKYVETEGNDALSDCIDCKAWTYSDVVSATSISTCIACPSDSNSPAGSAALTSCICNAGSSGPDGGTCTACVAGKYKSAIGNGPCLQCEAGKFKEASGAATCTTCLIGKYGAAGAVAESECMACPAGKFGGREGSSTCTECEAGKVSGRGEGACVTVAPVATAATHFVKLTLLFALTKSEFTVDTQNKLRESIAAAVGAKPADVTIDKIEAITGRRNFGRRLSSESVLVYITIKTADANEANAMATSLTADKINKALENAGLPNSTMKQTPTVTDAPTSPTGVEGGTSNQSITNIPIIIGSVVGGSVLLLSILAACHYFRCVQSKHPADDPEVMFSSSKAPSAFLQKSNEGGPYWDHGGDDVRRIVLADGKEKEGVIAAFERTLGSVRAKVAKVERVQNKNLWGPFAAKRETMLRRQDARDNYERTWLFHGTSEDSVDKIVTQGFNRNFGFKEVNPDALTMYGKGVYFAVNSSYSSNHRYSKPNSSGEQHMFLCRVLAGEYSLGKQDQLTAGVRKGAELFDSTVDNLKNPEIFVTYHDSQAYPQYLVTFKQE